MKNPENYQGQGGEVIKKSLFGRMALVGALVAVVPFNISMDLNAYKTSIINPTEQSEESDANDGQFKFATFNTAGKLNTLSNLSRVYESEKLDAVCLQEVHEKDLKYVSPLFPSSQIIFFGADRIVGMRKGEFGNAIISRTNVSDYYNRQIDGWTNFSKLFPPNLKDFRKEQRSVAFADYKVDVGKHDITSVRIINTHTAGDARQHRDVKNFIKSNTDNSKITIFCGDLNEVPEVTERDILPTKEGWDVRRLGQTSGGRQIDYLATNFGDVTKTLKFYDYNFKASVRPELNLGSDHYMAIGKLTAKLATPETPMTKGAEASAIQS